MNTNENWIAEQARLLDLEEGFGPSKLPARTPAEADAEEASAARPAAA